MPFLIAKIIMGCQNKRAIQDRSMSIPEMIDRDERRISARYLSTIFANSVGINWQHSAGTEMTPNTEERARKENWRNAKAEL